MTHFQKYNCYIMQLIRNQDNTQRIFVIYLYISNITLLIMKTIIIFKYILTSCSIQFSNFEINSSIEAFISVNDSDMINILENCGVIP